MAQSVTIGATAVFEILSVDPSQKRIGVALVEEGSSRAPDSAAAPDATPEPLLGALADKLRDALKGR